MTTQAVWLIGNTLILFSVVTSRQAQLVLGRVPVWWWVNHLGM